jgi:hypothetical protein
MDGGKLVSANGLAFMPGSAQGRANIRLGAGRRCYLSHATRKPRFPVDESGVLELRASTR